jgi:hypothetical protein
MTVQHNQPWHTCVTFSAGTQQPAAGGLSRCDMGRRRYRGGDRGVLHLRGAPVCVRCHLLLQVGPLRLALWNHFQV